MLLKKNLSTLLGALILPLIMSTTAYAATYTVNSGDSLYKISKSFNVSTDTLIKDNNLSNSTIYPGEKLNIKTSTYTVKSGDSLFTISKKYNTTIDILLKINPLKTTTLFVGQVINVPNTATSVATSATTSSSYTASDVDILSRLIMAEAQGEPYTAKVAVGAVIMNRLKSPLFPKTIKDVIYEKNGPYYQFTPVKNGWITKPANADSIKAAYAALNGTDPSKGALYYFDTTATNTWLRAKPVAATIGNLIFAY